jgi:hypothetical protein
MKAGWVVLNKGTKMITPGMDSIEDTIQLQLAFIDGRTTEEVKIDEGTLKKRKLLVQSGKNSYFRLTKGPAFAPTRAKAASDLTVEMLKDDAWKN